MKKIHYVFVVLSLMFVSFQYGRVYDVNRVVVDQREFNHVVYTDYCDIASDTTGSIYCIWYRNVPFVVDSTILTDL